MNCPYCDRKQVVKNGRRAGKQSYLCRQCGRQFRESPRRYNSQVREMCVNLSLQGIGFREIERLTGISHNTIIGWRRAKLER